MTAVQALESLGDPAAAGALDGLAARALDGRVRRSARVAAIRLRKRGERQPEVAGLSDEVERLRKQNADLLARMERLESRLTSLGGVAPATPPDEEPTAS
jgi:HEAT repeat protein